MSESLRIENSRIYALVCRWLACTIRQREHLTAAYILQGFHFAFILTTLTLSSFLFEISLIGEYFDKYQLCDLFCASSL